ncbi:MAG: nicotinamide riboside transporter PnuC [Bacteroidota bacterium]|nr:nicotinamide riboside transporter PnuC [Bacteroidota bacterium]
MEFLNIFNTFYQDVLNTTLSEAIAVAFGLASVWYAKKENILVFPTGIVSVLIYIYICFNYKLYADMVINIFYFVMSVYGWYMWTHKNNVKAEREITFCTTKQHIINGFALVVSYAIMYYMLSNYTDSDVPMIDSLTTSIFIVGMYLMALKKIENWIYWIVADFISVPLYLYKGLVLSSFQFAVFLVIAVLGYIEWKQRYKAKFAVA